MGTCAPPLGGGGGVFLVPRSSARGVEGVSWAAGPSPVKGPGTLVGAGPNERGSGMLVPEAAKKAWMKGVESRGCRVLLLSNKE